MNNISSGIPSSVSPHPEDKNLRKSSTNPPASLRLSRSTKSDLSKSSKGDLSKSSKTDRSSREVLQKLNPPSASPLSSTTDSFIRAKEKMRHLPADNKLQRWLEEEDSIVEGDVVNYDDAFAPSIEKLFQTLDTTNSEFKDTDLIVFNDDYQGPMPINGIKKTDLIEIEKILDSIQKGVSKIQISQGNDNYPLVMRDIKMLLTREIGRKIIKILHSSKLPINILPQESNRLRNVTATNEYDSWNKIITIDYKEDRIIGIDALGRRKFIQWPSFIRLGHEMIHAIHDITSYQIAADEMPLEGEWSNIREQITISGIRKPIQLREKNITEHEYYILNERNLSAAFTHVYDIWMPRQGHGSLLSKVIYTKDVESLTEEEKKLQEYFSMCIKWSTWTNMAEILNKHNNFLQNNFPGIVDYEAVLKETVFIVKLLQWTKCDDINTRGFSILINILSNVSSPKSQFLESLLTKFKALKDNQLDEFFNDLIVIIFKSKDDLPKNDAYQILFGDFLKDTKTLATYLANNYTPQECYIVHLLNHPEHITRLSVSEKEDAIKLIIPVIRQIKENAKGTQIISDLIKANKAIDDVFKMILLTELEKPEFSQRHEKLFKSLFKQFYENPNAIADFLLSEKSPGYAMMNYLIENPEKLRQLTETEKIQSHVIARKLEKNLNSFERLELADKIERNQLNDLFPNIFRKEKKRMIPFEGPSLSTPSSRALSGSSGNKGKTLEEESTNTPNLSEDSEPEDTEPQETSLRQSQASPLSRSRSATPLSRTRVAPLSQSRRVVPLSQSRRAIPLSRTGDSTSKLSAQKLSSKVVSTSRQIASSQRLPTKQPIPEIKLEAISEASEGSIKKSQHKKIKTNRYLSPDRNIQSDTKPMEKPVKSDKKLT